MRSKILYVVAGLFVLSLLIGVVVREKWSTPADELKIVLGYYQVIATGQRAYFETHGRYADFQQLLGSGAGKYRLHSQCEALYCFEVRGAESKYSIRIFPDRRISPSRHLSLYADETRIIRVTYGLPDAHAGSDVLSQEEISRFQPH